MDYNDFEEIVLKKKEEKPIWFEMDSLEIASIDEIEGVEYELKVKLPIEYSEFVRNYGGGYFAFTKVYSADASSEWNIVENNKKAEFNEKFIAVSDNGAGDYYGFEVIEGICNSVVSVYDHDQNMVAETKYQDFYEFLCEIGLRMT